MYVYICMYIYVVRTLISTIMFCLSVRLNGCSYFKLYKFPNLTNYLN